MYLVFSKKHTNGIAMWWRPNAQGYTNNLEDAGRYSQEEAEAYCAPSHGDDIAVEELAAYKLATRVIVDMSDGANHTRLMPPNGQTMSITATDEVPAATPTETTAGMASGPRCTGAQQVLGPTWCVFWR